MAEFDLVAMCSQRAGEHWLVECVADHEFFDSQVSGIRKGLVGIAYDFWFWGGDKSKPMVAVEWRPWQVDQKERWSIGRNYFPGNGNLETIRFLEPIPVASGDASTTTDSQWDYLRSYAAKTGASTLFQSEMAIRTPEEHLKDWGREVWIVNNGVYCGKILEVRQACQCSVHQHIKKCETFYLHSGKVLLQFHGPKPQERLLLPGSIVDVPRFQQHRFIGLDSVSEIIEFSTPHEESDSYRLVTGGKVGDEDWKRMLGTYLNG